MIYEERPILCKIYPFEKRLDETNNVHSPRFKECQYYANAGWLTPEELTKMKTNDEIEDYCNQCNLCCYLPMDGIFNLGERGFDLDWSKIFVDAEYWKETTILCQHCEVN
jgi:hypothetical protein